MPNHIEEAANMDIRRDLISAEAKTLREACNFTDDELEVFDLLIKNRSIVNISMQLNSSPRTVGRRVRSIKNKVAKYCHFVDILDK